MKAEILKIAGVKSEKEFYKKYPTEEAFMKAHKKEFKKAAMGSKMVKTQLEQLTDFGNPPQAQVGTQLDMWGNPLPIVQQVASPNNLYNPQTQQLGLNSPIAGSIPNPNLETQNTLWGTGGNVSNANVLGGTTPDTIQNMNLQSFGKSNTKFLDKLGGYAGIGQTASTLINAGRKLKKEKEDRKSAEMWDTISKLSLQAVNTKPEAIKRKYLRPEDQMVQPNQLFPSYGVGTNYLAKDGTRVMKIGGNLTEIQNTYAPNTLYDNLGYEPLDDSNQVKQFAIGGMLRDFNTAGGFNMLGTLGDIAIPNNAGGDIGGTIGGTAGMLVGGPLGQAVGSFIGKTAGKLIDKNPQRTQEAKERTKQTIGTMAFNQGIQGMQQGQYGNYMEDGGWVSHDWQPQVIATFGEHRMEDLLKRDPMMDTLRTGGRITQNNMFPTDQYALGGELKTTWGGYARPLGYNRHLPGTGEIAMFEGLNGSIGSHDQSDGNGHTGIGAVYGDGGKLTDYAEFGSKNAPAHVEVEKGEPVVQLPDTSSQESKPKFALGGNMNDDNLSMNVFGNLIVSKLVSPEYAGRKYKHVVRDLGIKTTNLNKSINSANEEIANLQVQNADDILRLNSLKSKGLGGDMKLAKIANDIQDLAIGQSATNETAEENGWDADALAKGKIKIDKEAMKQQAKFGKSIEKAQTGKNFQSEKEISDYYKSMGYTGPEDIDSLQKWIIEKAKTNPEVETELTSYLQNVPTTNKGKRLYGSKKASDLTKEQLYEQFNDKLWGYRFPKLKSLMPPYEGEIPLVDISGPWDKEDESKESSATTTGTETTKRKPTWMDMVNPILQQFIPTNQEAFDYSQVSPEMAAIAMNQLEPVQAQLYRPDLGTPMDISLQDIMNANQADFNATQRTMGYNPAAQAALSAMKYAANQKVLGEQFRLNQAEKQRVYDANRAILNDAQLKNLGILDTQMVRQSEAKSRTKQQTLEAMKSVADKIAKNKLENRQLGIYENLYKYRFDPSGRAINMNPLAQFDTEVGGSGSSKSASGIPEGWMALYDSEGNFQGTKKKSKKDEDTGRNGKIVKAIKNL